MMFLDVKKMKIVEEIKKLFNKKSKLEVIINNPKNNINIRKDNEKKIKTINKKLNELYLKLK